MSKTPLFRAAAIDATRVKWLGEILLVRPLSFTFLTLIAAVMGALLVGFMAFGTYSNRSTVLGQLVPDVGVIKLYAPQPAIVLEKRAREGEWIKKGQILYLISSERRSSEQVDIQETISRQVRLREQSLRDELRQTRRLHKNEEDALQKKISALKDEQANISHQLIGQRSRVQLAQAGVTRAEKLSSQGYISSEMAQTKQAELLDQLARFKGLQRDQISIEREIQSQKSELSMLPLRQQSQVAQINRLIASSTQEWTESEGRRTIAIVAPQAGRTTAATAEVGQAIDANIPLVSIIPASARLQALLFAPSRAIGFVQVGDKVLLRYQAYPYQKFGHARGHVSEISQIALSPTELAALPPLVTRSAEPLYRITVVLGDQTIPTFGKRRKLQAGMLVDADIMNERRKLYEWVLEPLLSLTGKL